MYYCLFLSYSDWKSAFSPFHRCGLLYGARARKFLPAAQTLNGFSFPASLAAPLSVCWLWFSLFYSSKCTPQRRSGGKKGIYYSSERLIVRCGVDMARLSLPSVFLTLLVVISMSSVPRLGESNPRDPPHLPKRETDSVNTHNRDFASLLLTMSLGLSSMANFIIPPLFRCYVMNLLRNMIQLPSNLPVYFKRKYNVSSSLCRILIVLLLIISGNVHVNPGPVIAPSFSFAIN